LNFNACRIIAYRHAGGDYLIVCGSNKQCQLLTSEGIFLGCIVECTKWIWCTNVKPNSTLVVSCFILVAARPPPLPSLTPSLAMSFRQSAQADDS